MEDGAQVYDLKLLGKCYDCRNEEDPNVQATVASDFSCHPVIFRGYLDTPCCKHWRRQMRRNRRQSRDEDYEEAALLDDCLSVSLSHSN